MNKIIIYSLYILVLIAISSCDMLSTRSPEEPNSNTSVFIPPTSYDIVISNFKKAVEEINIDNYILCFEPENYKFYPSADVNAGYEIIFADWNANSERFYLNSLSTENNISEKGILTLTNPNFEIITSDSAVYFSDYILKYDFLKGNTVFSGRIKLSILRNNTGIWHIRRWIDYKIEHDSISTTFHWEIFCIRSSRF